MSHNPDFLAAFRRGDRREIEMVYRFHMRSLEVYFRLLARRSGARELEQTSVVEDLLQDTFSRAFSTSAREAYDGAREFGPYLKAIARNCFIDLLRKRRRERHVLGAESLDTFEHLPSVEEPQDRRLVVALEDYLSGLSPVLKGVYETRFERGLSQAAACESLTLSRRSLRTLEEHLRRGFRKALVRVQLHCGPSRIDSSRAPMVPTHCSITGRVAAPHQPRIQSQTTQAWSVTA